jgi:hypothetical protein
MHDPRGDHRYPRCALAMVFEQHDFLCAACAEQLAR